MKKLFTNNSIRAIDNETISREQISSTELMEQAAEAFSKRFSQIISDKNPVLIVCGPGNNGGDGMGIARILHELNYTVEVLYVGSDHYSNDFIYQFERLRNYHIPYSEYQGITDEVLHHILKSAVIIDALFGSGLNRVIDGTVADLISTINKQNNIVVSVDLPSGIGESVIPHSDNTIKADYTISFQLLKLCCVLEENIPFLGELHLVDIGLLESAIEEQESIYNIAELKDARKKLISKKAYHNKWDNGHAVLVNGSESKAGAALLASEAALHSGCGMHTAIIPSGIKSAFNIRIPEAMILPDLHQQYITQIPLLPYADAYGIGCGIGTAELTKQAIFQFLRQYSGPLVIDADAINILATINDFSLTNNTILTPHFKEFDRLTKTHTSHVERIQTALEFCKQYQCTIILKASNSCICDPEGKVTFITTPVASLGKAGSGDLLTGLITSLLAQGYDNKSACIIALHLLNQSARLVEKKYTVFAASARLLVQSLPKAFKKLLP